MIRTKKNLTWLGTECEIKILIHLFVITTVINGTISNRAYSRSLAIEISSRKRLDNSEKIFQVDRHINDNKTMYIRNVLLSTGFDKMLHWIFNNEIEKGRKSYSGRSLKFKFGERFAFRKRLQFALLPIMYKMGVMTTLLTGLTILVLKGLTIGVILLIFAFGNYFTKLHKHSFQSTQPIHVHVHSQDGHRVTSFPSAVGPWDRIADEMPSGAFLGGEDLESYRQRLIQNSESMVKFRPFLY